MPSPNPYQAPTPRPEPENEQQKANHWYILSLFLGARRIRVFSRSFFVWVVIAGLFLALWLARDRPVVTLPDEALDDAIKRMPFAMPFVIYSVALSLVGVTVITARSRARRRLWQALKAPSSERWVEGLERQLRRVRVDEARVLIAQMISMAHSFFGERTAARAALARIDWAQQAPLLQGTGLLGEGYMNLLCDRDTKAATQKFARAKELAAVSHSVPGAKAGELAHATAIAAARALAGSPSPEDLELLEQAAKNRSSPPAPQQLARAQKRIAFGIAKRAVLWVILIWGFLAIWQSLNRG